MEWSKHQVLKGEWVKISKFNKPFESMNLKSTLGNSNVKFS